MIHYFSRHGYELKKATDGSSGYDLIAAEPRIVRVRDREMIPTGIYLAMSPGIEAQLRSRSGLSSKHGVVVINSPGTIDSDYRGEVKVCLINHGDADYPIGSGARIAQLVFAPILPEAGPLITSINCYENFTPRRVEALEHLGQTDRGDGGFGSTGI